MPQNFFLFLRCSAGYVNHDLLQVLDRSIDESLSSYLFIWTSFISEPKTKDFFLRWIWLWIHISEKCFFGDFLLFRFFKMLTIQFAILSFSILLPPALLCRSRCIALPELFRCSIRSLKLNPIFRRCYLWGTCACSVPITTIFLYLSKLLPKTYATKQLDKQRKLLP